MCVYVCVCVSTPEVINNGVVSLPRLVGHNLGLPSLIVEAQWKRAHHKNTVHRVSLFKHKDFMHFVNNNYSHYSLFKQHKVHSNLLSTTDACINYLLFLQLIVAVINCSISYSYMCIISCLYLCIILILYNIRSSLFSGRISIASAFQQSHGSNTFPWETSLNQ